MSNVYDNPEFFEQYAKMQRSQQGLAGAGEWHQFKDLFPDLQGKDVLDLGCGYGWHSKYVADQGARQVIGIDLSEKMIQEARAKNGDSKITYRICGIEEYEYPTNTFDCVISNLVLHYIADLETVFKKIFLTLKPEGVFLLNMEHPVFTAGVNQDWIYDSKGKPQHWPIDNYFFPGERTTHFLGQSVMKQHHTLTQILMGIIHAGFHLDVVEEATPEPSMMTRPGMADELRRPMMLLVRASKKKS